MWWIGISLALFGLVAGVSVGGNLGTFINLPSLMFVLITGLGIVIAAHGANALRAMRAAFVTKIDDEASGEQIRNVARTSIVAFVVAGIIGAIVGIVQMLSTLEDPSQIGVGMATALLTPLYGIVFAFVFCYPIGKRA